RLISCIFSTALHKTEERLIFQNIGLYNFSPDKSQEKNIAHTLLRGARRRDLFRACFPVSRPGFFTSTSPSRRSHQGKALLRDALEKSFPQPFLASSFPTRNEFDRERSRGYCVAKIDPDIVTLCRYAGKKPQKEPEGFPFRKPRLHACSIPTSSMCSPFLP
ncbi:MAG: hypothetical protein KJ772_00435, partial [Proteobacteria bacterium]|nr:hypothetical protein [Pseudomonadota bacterium]MBU4407156.1 hypothetical protein [Pseudomonadota bacterium]